MKIPSICVISAKKEFVDRCRVLTKRFQAELMEYKNPDVMSEDEANAKLSQFVVLDAIDSKNQQETAGLVQVARYMATEAQIVVVVEKKVTAEDASFIKKSGANRVLLEDEYFNNSKVEFIYAQKAHSSIIPIKASELVANKPVDMTLLHLMPLNQKFIPFLQKGQILDEARHKKLQSVGEFYIHREEAANFQKYIEANQDKSAAGLKSRCRAQFLNMTFTYKDLVQLITDQSEATSFKEGKELFDRTLELCQNLLNSMGAIGEAWDVVNNSAVDDLTAIDRAPAIAAYAGLMSLMLGIGNPEEVMMCALIADIGLLDLKPEALETLSKQGLSAMKEDDQDTYKKHALLSINRCLARKLPIPENFKNIILCTHECADGSGYPKQLDKSKIPEESFLIQYAEKMDKAALVEFGKERITPQELRKKLFTEEQALAGKQFPFDFLAKIKALEW